MNEMVERVARKLWIAAHCPGTFDTGPVGGQARFRELARAAIEAMLEPTEAMMDAGDLAQTEMFGMNMGFQVAMSSGIPWRAMVKEALK